MGETSEPFEYAVLRAVPRVERGEFVNVGVLLYSQGKDFLEVSVHLDEGRLRALDPGVDLDVVRSALEGFRRACADPDRPRRERFGWLTAPRSTVIQVSPVHCGVADDPAGQLDRLMRRLVMAGDSPQPAG